MFKKFKQLGYGVRVLLSRSGGQPETVAVAGRSIVLMHGGKGTPFVYLHSTVGESFLWFPFLQRLARDFHVYVPTHPGFGASTGFDQINNIEDMASHYAELFDALGLDEKIVLGGVSLGGWIAAEFAARWPERVKKLWIADAPGLPSEEAQLGDLFGQVNDRDKLRELLFFDPHSPMASLIVRDRMDEKAKRNANQNLTVLARMVKDQPYDPSLAAQLHRVECPTLLLWGEHDRLVPVAFAREYKKHIRNAELQLIPNCGHLPMFEKEGAFVEALARFCRD